GGPPEPPYDLTGYELSLQMDVKADRVAEPFPLPGPAVEEVPSAAGGVRGEGSWGWALSPASNDASRAVNELLGGDERMFRAAGTFEAAGRSWPSGTWVVQGGERDRLASLGQELGLAFHALSAAPRASLREVRTPRIGLYRGHTANMPEGWTRWILERYGFRYRSLSNEDVRAGDFGDLDVVILPDQDADDILNGHRPGTMPSEYVGGVGVEGAAALRRWVEGGGWVLALDHGADFPIQQFGLPLLNAVSGSRPEEFFIPGSLVRIQVDVSDPLGWGMAENAVAFFVQSQVFRVVPPASGGGQQAERDVTVFARYAEREPLASGWANGAERYLAGAPAGVRLPLGQGQVVLVGFEPHFRGQPHNTFKLLFNPLYAATMEGTAPDDDGGTGSAGQGEDR
ncbi:MAG: peptidase M14, partial [bacterium]